MTDTSYPMVDFASTSLLNLIVHELNKQGVEATINNSFEGTVPRPAKAELLNRALMQVGTAGILQIGFGIRCIDDDPFLNVLSNATDVQDLLVRWQRLERYLHGKHRVKYLSSSDTTMQLEHYAIKGSAPSIGEDLLIAGLLAALLLRIHVDDVNLVIDGQHVIASGNVLPATDIPTQSGIWSYSWRASDRIRPPASQATPPATHSAYDSPQTRDFVSQLNDLLKTDLARSWKLADAASELAVSSRTLQRRLSESGHSFQTALRTARTEGAAALLLKGRQPLELIGYECGFSDQSHFCREFKTHLNMTPSDYQQLNQHA